MPRSNPLLSILTHFRSKHSHDKDGNDLSHRGYSIAASTQSGTRSPAPNLQFISLSILDQFNMLLIKWLPHCFITGGKTYFLALVSFLGEAFAKLMPSRKSQGY